jgi:glucose/mannose transport system substrate-binding protein
VPKFSKVAAALVPVALGITLAAGPASAQQADVMHWWTSGGESRAVAVFAKEYDKRGGTWVDDASVGPQTEHAAALTGGAIRVGAVAAQRLPVS